MTVSHLSKLLLTPSHTKNAILLPTTLECVGYVQKRLGTRLRNKVKEYKGISIPIGGRVQLHEKMINSMQNFYGIPIRQNLNEKYEMKKAIGAILFHCTDIANPAIALVHHEKRADVNIKRTVTGKSTYKKTIKLPKWMYHCHATSI